MNELVFGKGRLNRRFEILFRNSTTNSEINRVETFWRVTSNVKPNSVRTFLRLWAFHTWEFLSIEQIQLLNDFPGLLDELFFIALKAKKEIGIFETVRRTRNWNKFWGSNIPYGRNVLLQWIGNHRIEVSLVTKPIRPHKRYSGYVRNSSSVGSKKRSSLLRPEAEHSELKVEMINIFEEYLTVGYISSYSGTLSLPDEP